MSADKIAEIRITQKLRVTMPDFKGIEISCPCRIRSLLMEEAADEIEKLIRERDDARAEVERLRAEVDHERKSHGAYARFREEAENRLESAIERLIRERDEARAEVERLRDALRDALDGLRYWVPQTSAGAVERSRIMEKGIEALEAKP